MIEETTSFHHNTLPDAFAKNGEIALDRYFEREKFSPILLVILVAFSLFFLFQIIGAVVAIMFILPQVGNPPDMAKVMKLLESDIGTQLIGNTIGQFLGLLLPTLLITKLHTSQVADFLRIRNFHLPTILIAVLGLIVLYPLILATGQLNELLPKPSFFNEMDKMREDMIKNMLIKSNVVFNFLAIALTPAICEEIMFRGYIQRQMERKFTALTAILVTGFTFGMYHLSFEQVLPLSFIGIYLCFLTWKTGSIYPAIFVHLFNNGISVIVGSIYAKDKSFNPSDFDKIPAPWYGTVLSVMISLGLFWLIYQHLNRTYPKITSQNNKLNPLNPESNE